MVGKYLRYAMLHGVLIVLVGMLVAGIPLTGIIMRDVYHMPIAQGLPGDYRSWLMAHLEGLLNGLLVIALAQAASLRVMPARRCAVLFWGLAAMGWGNLIGAILAPLLAVRGMAFDANIPNDIVTGIFGIGFIGTLVAFYIVIRNFLTTGD